MGEPYGKTFYSEYKPKRKHSKKTGFQINIENLEEVEVGWYQKILVTTLTRPSSLCYCKTDVASAILELRG